MPALTDSDYDALYVVVKDQMPRVSREIFPQILAQLEATGVLTVSVTDIEISVSSVKPPATVVYRVERKPRVH